MQFNSIPASNIAAVYPAVIGGGGNPLGLNTTLFVNEAVYPNYEYFSNTLVGQHYGLERCL
ncbi:tail sheath protein [Acinetobacter phage Ab65]|nr:tail sheath protein [Acinetobacter phage Ab69]WMC00607.1 tail sheath protein [Acinetobacter phage Ab65]